jgi:hypothetical protein
MIFSMGHPDDDIEQRSHDDSTIYFHKERKKRRGIFSSAMRTIRSLQDVTEDAAYDEESQIQPVIDEWHGAYDKWHYPSPRSGRIDLIETPRHMGDMFEDVLVYIFSFMSYRDNIRASQTCKSWYNTSSMYV